MTIPTPRPLHPSLGAEVCGLDLRETLSVEDREALAAALAEHIVLVFRDQSFKPAEYLAACSQLGEPMAQHYSQHNMPDQPMIGRIWHRNGQRPAERWHTDHTNRERPPKATILYGVEIPPEGGDTSFANMRAAYAGLDADERERLAGLKTVNGLDRHLTDTRAEDWEKYDIPAIHPMVRTHPEHGSRALYFHITKARCIEGMKPEASQILLQDLLDRTIHDGNVYRHSWRQGDMVVCDNRAAMHRAHGASDRRHPRTLWRIILEGDRPV